MNAAVFAIAIPDAILRINADGVRDGELSRPAALAAPGADVFSIGAIAVNMVVAVAVRDDDVAIGGDGDVGGAVEGSAFFRTRLAGGAQGQEQISCRAELVDGVIGSVGDEDIILFVYKNAMGAARGEYAVAPGGEMVAVRVIDIEGFIATRIDEDAVL